MKLVDVLIEQMYVSLRKLVMMQHQNGPY